MERNSWASTIYSIGIGILPIMMLFNFNVRGIYTDKLFLIVFAMLTCVKIIHKGDCRIKTSLFFPIFIYCVIIAASSMIHGSCGLFGVTNLWIALLICLCFSSRFLLDFKIVRKTLTIIALIATILIVVQYIFHYGLHMSWNPIPVRILRNDLVENYALKLTDSMFGGLFRPSSIFFEPAHYAEYCLVALCCNLFDENPQIKTCVLITLGIFLSTSGLGIMLTIVVWAYKYIVLEKNTSKKIKAVLLIMALVGIIYYILDSIGASNLVLARFSLSGGAGSGIKSRFGDVEYLFQRQGKSIFFFGEGFDTKINYWLVGALSIFRQIGFIGLVTYLLVLLTSYKVTNAMGKGIVLLFLGLLCVAEVSNSSYMVFYLSIPVYFAYCKYEEVD